MWWNARKPAHTNSHWNLLFHISRFHSALLLLLLFLNEMCRSCTLIWFWTGKIWSTFCSRSCIKNWRKNDTAQSEKCRTRRVKAKKARITVWKWNRMSMLVTPHASQHHHHCRRRRHSRPRNHQEQYARNFNRYMISRQVSISYDSQPFFKSFVLYWETLPPNELFEKFHACRLALMHSHTNALPQIYSFYHLTYSKLNLWTAKFESVSDFSEGKLTKRSYCLMSLTMDILICICI